MSLVKEIEIEERGCGLRKEGGLYLVGGNSSIGHPWFPRAVKCACGIPFMRPSRNIQVFQPGLVFPELRPDDAPQPVHADRAEFVSVGLRWHTFPLEEKAWCITVGVEHYPTPEEYLREAEDQGISRLIRAIPHGFKLGESYIFIMHPRTFDLGEKRSETGRKQHVWEPGIIAAFRPQELQYVTTGNESESYLKSLIEQGITPVKVSYR